MDYGYGLIGHLRFHSYAIVFITSPVPAGNVAVYLWKGFIVLMNLFISKSCFIGNHDLSLSILPFYVFSLYVSLPHLELKNHTKENKKNIALVFWSFK
jgi:hypothetical protein